MQLYSKKRGHIIWHMQIKEEELRNWLQFSAGVLFVCWVASALQNPTCEVRFCPGLCKGTVESYWLRAGRGFASASVFLERQTPRSLLSDTMVMVPSAYA